MKKEKGITLISLILYILLLIIVIGMLSGISAMFYSNTGALEDNSRNLEEFNRFNMYFLENVKNNKTAIIKDSNIIIFEDGTTYTYLETDKGIYKDKIKICNNIDYCTFSSKNEITNNTTKQIITVDIIINDSEGYNNDYVLKYW